MLTRLSWGEEGSRQHVVWAPVGPTRLIAPVRRQIAVEGARGSPGWRCAGASSPAYDDQRDQTGEADQRDAPTSRADVSPARSGSSAATRDAGVACPTDCGGAQHREASRVRATAPGRRSRRSGAGRRGRSRRRTRAPGWWPRAAPRARGSRRAAPTPTRPARGHDRQHDDDERHGDAHADDQRRGSRPMSRPAAIPRPRATEGSDDRSADHVPDQSSRSTSLLAGERLADLEQRVDAVRAGHAAHDQQRRPVRAHQVREPSQERTAGEVDEGQEDQHGQDEQDLLEEEQAERHGQRRERAASEGGGTAGSAPRRPTARKNISWMVTWLRLEIHQSEAWAVIAEVR